MSLGRMDSDVSAHSPSPNRTYQKGIMVPFVVVGAPRYSGGEP